MISSVSIDLSKYALDICKNVVGELTSGQDSQVENQHYLGVYVYINFILSAYFKHFTLPLVFSNRFHIILQRYLQNYNDCDGEEREAVTPSPFPVPSIEITFMTVYNFHFKLQFRSVSFLMLASSLNACCLIHFKSGNVH